MEMEEPVLVSENSISSIIEIVFLLFFGSIVIFFFSKINIYLNWITIPAFIFLFVKLILFNLKSYNVSFYNEYFDLKGSSSYEKVFYSEIEKINIHTSTFRVQSSLTYSINASQNDVLKVKLKNGREIIFEEAMYDNFKLIRKLFTELSEKDDTSRLN
ncbi:MAG: hypothetical protein RIQ33_2272 [Bacteroidota bacterium]|jgi:hypothetical protein